MKHPKLDRGKHDHDHRHASCQTSDKYNQKTKSQIPLKNKKEVATKPNKHQKKRNGGVTRK